MKESVKLKESEHLKGGIEVRSRMRNSKFAVFSKSASCLSGSLPTGRILVAVKHSHVFNGRDALSRVSHFLALLSTLLFTSCDNPRETPGTPTADRLKLPAPSVTSEDFLARWDASMVAKGTAEREVLAANAIAALAGDGGEGLSFMLGLVERREFDLANALLTAQKEAIFSGHCGIDARDWLIGAKDGEFKKQLCFEAGYYFSGPGLESYIGRLFPAAAQESFLTGYACRIAESNPVRAINEYKSLRSGEITFYGLLDVMDYLDPDGDFAKADAIFPDDYDEANNMGAALRQRLLKRWASVSPEAAAQYVASMPGRIKPVTIRIVIAKWAETSPVEALAWLEKTPDGPFRDDGLSELANIALKDGKPLDAWQHVVKIGDFENRVDLATEVFKVWERTDHEAAQAAWLKAFPE